MKPVRRARVLKSKQIFKGRVITLKVERVREPGGVVTNREVVEHPGSVVVIPVLPDGRVLLVRQYRHAARQYLWELVAGGIEPRETPRRAAARELQEEAGYLARTLKPVFDFYPSPGILNERMHLVEAHGLHPAASRPDADERIEVGCFTPARLRQLLRQNRIKDGKTLVGLGWFFRRAR